MVLAQEELQLEVTEVRPEARDVLLIELRSPSGVPLPAFTPGAHLELSLPNQLVRHYSLSNDCRERDRYVIGVGLAAQSRGGSEFIHRFVRCGDLLTVRGPRNHFALDTAALDYLLIAGGIGITPIMSMVRWMADNAKCWRLIYTSRSRQRAAFYEELRSYGDFVHFHFDDEMGGIADIAQLLSAQAEGSHIYCCGPAPLMQAVEQATTHLPEDRVRYERFSAPPAAEQDTEGETPHNSATGFTVELKRSGVSLEIPADKSILEVLEAHGYQVPFSCREGLCGTCETKVCGGEPEHRDYVLSEEQQAAGTAMMICVSRAKSETLVLDL